MTDQTTDDIAVLNERQAARYLGISLITLKRLRANGTAPKLIRLSKRRIGFRKATLDAWLADREVSS